MFPVKFILSFFTFLIKLLDQRTRTLDKDEASMSDTITALIHKREAARSEKARAIEAKKKLKEFVL